MALIPAGFMRYSLDEVTSLGATFLRSLCSFQAQRCRIALSSGSSTPNVARALGIAHTVACALASSTPRADCLAVALARQAAGPLEFGHGMGLP